MVIRLPDPYHPGEYIAVEDNFRKIDNFRPYIGPIEQLPRRKQAMTTTPFDTGGLQTYIGQATTRLVRDKQYSPNLEPAGKRGEPASSLFSNVDGLRPYIWKGEAALRATPQSPIPVGKTGELSSIFNATGTKPVSGLPAYVRPSPNPVSPGIATPALKTVKGKYGKPKKKSAKPKKKFYGI